jgi:hypothetical protein
LVLISWLKSWITGISRAVEQELTQSKHSWFLCFSCTGWTVLRRLSKTRVKVLKLQPLHPCASHLLQSYSNGLKEIKVLCEEHPPRTFARECLMCELPMGCSVVP